MKYLYILLAFLFISIQTPAKSSLFVPGNEEDEFWSSYAKSDFKTAGEISEKLSESNIDYLFLSAICDFNQYNYTSYMNKSDRYYLMKNRDYSSLKDLLGKHYREDRHELNNLMGIVKFLISSIDLEPSRHFLERSIALEEYNPVAYNFLARVYLQEGNFDRTIELALKSISMVPTYPEPYNTLAFAWYRKGNPHRAMDKLLEGMIACSVNPNDTYVSYIRMSCNTVTLHVGDTTVSVPSFKSDALRDHTLDKLKGYNRPLFELAYQFFFYESYAEVDSLLEVISVDTTIQDKYYYLYSLNAFKSGDTARFEEGVENMVRLNESGALLDLGSYFYKSGNLKRAQDIFKMAEHMTVTDQTAMKVQSNLGAVELKLGNYRVAVKHFKKALKKNSGDVITLTNLGIAYFRTEKNKKATRYLLKAKENCTSSEQTKTVDYWLKKID